MKANLFTPYEELAERLLPVLTDRGDGAHDSSHIARVWANAKAIQADDGGDLELITAAVILHDCIQVAKDSPERMRASKLSAAKARAILEEFHWPAHRVDTVAGAIESHSFSGGIQPSSIEGAVLQDADRLDAIGMTGIARCFYTAGRMGSKLYEPSDPAARSRSLDDEHFALDHFPAKLLRLSSGFQTPAGRRLAQKRHITADLFYRTMLEEIGVSAGSCM